MTQQNVAAMRKYCVVCEKELEPDTKSHCTDTSLVATRKAGIIFKYAKFFTLDGAELSRTELNRISASEKLKAEESGTEEARRLIVHHCRICGKKNATVREVGYNKYYLCSNTCAAVLDRRVIADAMSRYRNIVVVGSTPNLSVQTDRSGSQSYFCYWCGADMGVESVYECPVCAGRQLVK